MNEPLVLGRYLVCDEIGGGGMAKVHLGRALGAAGFSRVVAIKRLHPSNVDDAEYTTMLLDEARLVARIRHPNVVPTLDVVSLDGELILVMEYVHGPSLAWLARALSNGGQRAPLRVAVRIVLDVLAGLHAAHEAKSERGRPLGMVHRDVSPHNILVSEDGAARLADFGIAKADGKMSLTQTGQVKGKLSYMAPEQLRGESVDRRADVFATGIVLWELLTGRELFPVPPEGFVAGVVQKILAAKITPPSSLVDSPPALDAVVATALQADPDDRFATAEEMATALEAVAEPATPKEVAAWIASVAGALLDTRTQLVTRIEEASAIHDGAALVPRSPSPPAMPAPPTELERVPLPVAVRAKAKRSSMIVAALALGAVAGLAALGAFGVMKRSANANANASANASANANANADANADADEKGVASSAASSTASGSPSMPPANAASAAGSASTARPASAGSAGRRHPATKPPAPDCDPPYSVDPQGVRIPRRECLDR